MTRYPYRGSSPAFLKYQHSLIKCKEWVWGSNNSQTPERLISLFLQDDSGPLYVVNLCGGHVFYSGI